jgi:hypothetical protein
MPMDTQNLIPFRNTMGLYNSSHFSSDISNRPIQVHFYRSDTFAEVKSLSNPTEGHPLRGLKNRLENALLSTAHKQFSVRSSTERLQASPNRPP